MQRQGLNVPEMGDLTYNNKSHSMTDMMLKTSLQAQSDPNAFAGYPWTGMPFSKSLSTSAIIKEVYNN